LHQGRGRENRDFRIDAKLLIFGSERSLVVYGGCRQIEDASPLYRSAPPIARFRRKPIRAASFSLNERRLEMADTDIATDETNRLIASNKVEGTAVYDRNGNRLGSVYNFMVD
jgi:hypothetical protein